MTPYSMAPMKRQKSHDLRAHQRNLMSHERWDDLPTHYVKNIIWEYW